MNKFLTELDKNVKQAVDNTAGMKQGLLEVRENAVSANERLGAHESKVDEALSNLFNLTNKLVQKTEILEQKIDMVDKKMDNLIDTMEGLHKLVATLTPTPAPLASIPELPKPELSKPGLSKSAPVKSTATRK